MILAGGLTACAKATALPTAGAGGGGVGGAEGPPGGAGGTSLAGGGGSGADGGGAGGATGTGGAGGATGTGEGAGPDGGAGDGGHGFGGDGGTDSTGEGGASLEDQVTQQCEDCLIAELASDAACDAAYTVCASDVASGGCKNCYAYLLGATVGPPVSTDELCPASYLKLEALVTCGICGVCTSDCPTEAAFVACDGAGGAGGAQANGGAGGGGASGGA